MLDFGFTERLKEQLKHLSKRDKPLAEAVKKKVAEIVSRDAQTIRGYKNLRAPLNEFKRVHVGSFVLAFRFYEEKNFVYFDSFEHHDEAYGR
ncbi:hypothetical protein AUJ16_01670 [Candidatus Micrarchaeota archaeon CG1_02_60_51]|nr:MAG: hypothetical protein AUJ16_01670 [Candidatus Micrarchaeota archaeon CG1_02_60_51]PIO01885.1 MAG: addiction module toxin RelE [Candidatus Micrarchaeota archaeon CG09_land_8_20_14_0_10_60_16]PIY91487.1 MAG: addiction module toxin RelE [Candidatus Micrarchaeota archaeon CG_4_10_14_0_8_um_filter_60_7]